MGDPKEKIDPSTTIDVQKDLTIGVVADLKERILKELSTSDGLTLNLERVENMDVAGLQILCSANRYVESKKKSFSIITGENQGFIKTFMVESGYDSTGSCPEGTCKKCLWKGDRKKYGKENSDS